MISTNKKIKHRSINYTSNNFASFKMRIRGDSSNITYCEIIRIHGALIFV